jgi:hypothetical protein
MPQLFSPAANTVFRIGIALILGGGIGMGALGYIWARSDQAWNVGKPAPQPIPFRHDLHTGTLGIGCGYCHTTAARAADAGMPSAETCMTCHAQVWVGASVLQPLRTSLALNQPIEWTSVHRLPAYAYFHHAAHVSTGVACATCHGDMTRMPKTVRVNTLSMGWCLDCHRDPARYLSEQDAARIIGLPSHAARQARLYEGREVQGIYEAVTRHLTSCNTCHR